jgi:hypothetical protein
MPKPLFRTWTQYAAWLVVGIAACLLLNGVIRMASFGTEDKPPTAPSTYAPVPLWFEVQPYAALWRWDAITYGDYRPVFAAAHAKALDPQNADMYHPEELKRNLASFVYTPFTALVFRPIAGQEWTLEESADVVSWLNHVMWIGAAVLLAMMLCHGRPWSWALVGAFVVHYLLYYPNATALHLTQASIWIMFFLVLTGFCLQRGWDVAAGIAFAFAISFKPHLAVVPALLFFLPRFPKRPMIVCGTMFTTLMLLSLGWAGIRNWQEYLGEVLPMLSRGYAYYPNQTFNGLLRRLFGPDDPAEFDLPRTVIWIKYLSSAFGLALLAVAYRSCFKRREEPTWDDHTLAYASVMSAGVLASPVCWDHHMTAFVVLYVVIIHRLVKFPHLRTRRIEGLLFGSFLLTGAYFETRGLWGAEAIFSGLGFYGALMLLAAAFLLCHRRETEAAA